LFNFSFVLEFCLSILLVDTIVASGFLLGVVRAGGGLWFVLMVCEGRGVYWFSSIVRLFVVVEVPLIYFISCWILIYLSWFDCFELDLLLIDNIFNPLLLFILYPFFTYLLFHSAFSFQLSCDWWNSWDFCWSMGTFWVKLGKRFSWDLKQFRVWNRKTTLNVLFWIFTDRIIIRTSNI